MRLVLMVKGSPRLSPHWEITLTSPPSEIPTEICCSQRSIVRGKSVSPQVCVVLVCTCAILMGQRVRIRMMCVCVLFLRSVNEMISVIFDRRRHFTVC